jgi:hypothetical protein
MGGPLSRDWNISRLLVANGPFMPFAKKRIADKDVPRPSMPMSALEQVETAFEGGYQ